MPTGQVTLLRQRPLQSTSGFGAELGSIPLIGEIQNGIGVEPRGHLRTYGSYALMLVLRGSGVYRDGRGLSVPLNAGDLVWVFPDIAHTYGTLGPETWDEIYVIFGGPVFDLWRSKRLLDDLHPVTQLGDPQPWRERILEFSEESAARRSPIEELGRFQSLLGEILSQGKSDVGAAGERWIRQAQKMLSSDLRETISPAAVAAALGLGYDLFRRDFAELVGIPPARYRAKQRAAAAAELLLYTQMTHRQIAVELGYRDEFYFAKCFRSFHGVWPSEYRKSGPRA